MTDEPSDAEMTDALNAYEASVGGWASMSPGAYEAFTEGYRIGHEAGRRAAPATVTRDEAYADAVNLAAERSPFGHPLPESEIRAARAGVDAIMALLPATVTPNRDELVRVMLRHTLGFLAPQASDRTKADAYALADAILAALAAPPAGTTMEDTP